MDSQNWVGNDEHEQAAQAVSYAPSIRLSTLPEQGERVDPENIALTPEDIEEAFSIAAMGVWRWEIGSDSLRWSAEIFRIAGRDPASFVPTLERTLQCIHPDDRQSVREGLLQAGHSVSATGLEFRVVRPDSSERYCWAKISRVVEGGRVVAIRGILLDLTSRREAELALKTSEQHYRDTIDLSPQMPWTASPEGAVLTVSARWTHLTGLPEEAALGAGWIEQLHPDDREAVRQSVARSLSASEPLDIKARLRCVDGELRWIRARAFPKLDEKGRVGRWYGLTEDVDAQERAIASLRESEEHYRYTLELNPQIPWNADPQGNIIEAGPRWAKMVGAHPGGWTAALHPDDVAGTLQTWRHALATGERLDLRYRLRQLDGAYRWFRVRAGARLGDDGSIQRWYGVLEDIEDQVRTECALRAQEEWLRKAHSAAAIGVFEVDLVCNLAKLSPQSLVLHGRNAEDDPIFPGESWAELVHPDDGERAWQAVRDAVEGGDTYDCTFRVPLADGSVRWINGLGRVEYGDDGQPRRLLGINMDVTARREAEAALFDSEALNRSIVDASPDAIKLLGEDGTVMFANQACHRSMELGEHVDLTGRNWVELWPSTVRPQVSRALADAAAGEIGRFTAPRATASGRPKWWDVVVSPVFADHRHPHRFVTIARDVTEQKTAEDRIQWSATHDPLTHLPNRRHFDERLTMAISAAEAAAEGLALFILDVDGFKQINDTLGHDAGDAVLRTLADRLRTSLRPCDTVARLGGDEFAVILPGIGDAANARRIASDIRQRLREPVSYLGASLDCRASVGASLFPIHGSVPGDLLKHADIALYSAKASRGGELLIFEPQMRAELQQRVSMINVARDALHQDRFRAFYQPKVDLVSGRVAGFEALTRWVDLRGNAHLPATIAAAFEDWDVSTAITEMMLHEVVRQIGAWEAEGLDFGHVALNASTPDLQRRDFVDVVLDSLRQGGVSPRRLQIEVTESVFLGRGADLVEQSLQRFCAAGVKIALDDFGTGYASLTHLKQFPVDILKIDRSFIADIDRGAQQSAIPEALVALGRNLGLEVVAEGVETQSQADRLVQLGCQYAQGFLYSAAISGADASALIRRLAETSRGAG